MAEALTIRDDKVTPAVLMTALGGSIVYRAPAPH